LETHGNLRLRQHPAAAAQVPRGKPLECDASVELGGRASLPVVPANMKTVVDESICQWMAQNGYFYVMHRFDWTTWQFVRDMHAQGLLCLDLAGREKARLRHGGPAGGRGAWCPNTSPSTSPTAMPTA
jgi:hypothetical protein